ncbi:hypothetical protein WNY77_15760 [Paraglaciecola mesophila]|uniref:Uncharacterized protein n=1 Tax=Paraglaciecola mesophila TaxID=197222 RepID=A0ABU9SYB9_9ALTE
MGKESSTGRESSTGKDPSVKNEPSKGDVRTLQQPPFIPAHLAITP